VSTADEIAAAFGKVDELLASRHCCGTCCCLTGGPCC
jgi:hypothetical protein